MKLNHVLWLVTLKVIAPTSALFASSAQIIDSRPALIGGAHGMEVDAEGHLFLADTFRSARTPQSWLFAWQPFTAGAATLPQKTALSGMSLAGISRSQRGYLVCDVQASMVAELTPDFKPIQSWTVANPWNAHQDSQGDIYSITHGGQLLKLLPGRRTSRILSGLDAPFDFAFGERDGEIWISEQGMADGRVLLWDISDESKPRLMAQASHPFRNPEGLVFSKGSAWVLDTESGELVKVARDGSSERVLEGLGTPILIRPKGDAFLIYSNLYPSAPALITVRPL